MSKKTKLMTMTESERPQEWNEIIDVTGQVKEIRKIIDKKIKQHLLFIGPAGTGKTTTGWVAARAFVKKNISKMALMQGASFSDHIEYINASSVGIDVIRNRVQTLVDISGVNVIILDEFDGISKPSQHALRSIMEEAERKTSPKLFILTGNYLNKIIDPIISRCGAQVYVFPRIPYKMMKQPLIDLCIKVGVIEMRHPEGIPSETENQRNENVENFFKSVYYKVKGDMRKAVKFLETAIEVTEKGKVLNLVQPMVDIRTNAFYLQLNAILLSTDTVTYKRFLDSIDELISKKDENKWDGSSFFDEAFQWLKDNETIFEHKEILILASIIAKFENRLGNSFNSMPIQLNAMVSEMRLARLDSLLESIMED